MQARSRYQRATPAAATLALLLAGGAGCTVPNQHARGPDAGAADSVGPAWTDGVVAGGDAAAATDGAAGVGTITIFVKGDLSKVGFSDGLAGQTPRDYTIALSRYHVLRSADDPAPVLCFDHGPKPALTNIAKDNEVGSCRTSSIPTGPYTHGRTKVDWARYTVDGVYHYLGQKLTGSFTFFRAFSDVVHEGKPFKAGQGTITFSGATKVEIPVTYGPLPPMPGVSFKLQGGELSMTFRYTKPLLIEQQDTHAHWARFNWKIADSFRWADAQGYGYAKGVWDVALLPSSSEQVLLHGVSGYYVTSSKD